MKRILATLPIVLLVASVSLNTALASKVKELRATITALKSESSLKIGQAIPELAVTDLKGTPTTVKFTDSSLPTVLYVFTPACGWCSRNKDNVRALFDASAGRFSIVGLSLHEGGLSEFIAEHRIDFPVYLVPDSTRAQLKLGGTPQTLVVTKNGKLEKNWRGAYTGSLKSEIESALNVRLPGVLPTPPRALTTS